MAIGELGEQLGLLKQAAKVQPISSSDYPTPARRPAIPCWIAPVHSSLISLPALA